jgi:large subunit ribosomal protein L13
MKTYVPKQGEIQRQWYLVDASGQRLGRLASDIARVLRGKHKPSFTPNADVGDFVVVVNAAKVTFSGKKLTDKLYYRHSGFPGGLRTMTLEKMLQTHPERVLEEAVRGMLPHNKLGAAMLGKLKVYPGPEHPHGAQQPESFAQVFAGQPSGARFDAESAESKE